MASSDLNKSARELTSLYKDKSLKEMSKEESYAKVRSLLKQQTQLSRAKMKPGSIVFTSYDAKFKEHTYDKTPLIFVLRTSPNYTLGINFHWLPLAHRVYLIDQIMRKNANNIKREKPLEFSYAELKPMLKSLGYAPCIRLYINKRLAKRGVVIPIERLKEVARLKTETFTQGRYSASQLFQMAKNGKTNKAKKRDARQSKRKNK